MKVALTAASALMLSTYAAHAGALDRTGQSVAVLFEKGRYAEFSFGSINPSVTGVGTAGVGGGASGNMSKDYLQYGAAYKADINDTWSYALIFDKPYGADVDYPTGTGYFAAGSTAEFTSNAITGILQYNMPSNLSFYGGIRLQTISADAVIPFASGYSATGDRDFGVGYLAGVAYEMPDIALRVSLTYNSAIEHELDTVENSIALGGPNASTTPIDTPQSVNLEFQTGIAQDTLLFGSVRWAEWSDFDITPVNYQTLTGGGSLVSYNGDIVTYTLGLGRRINDTWSVAATVGYEEPIGGFTTNLGPTDGQTSLGLAATYTRGNMKISGGVRYVMIEDTQTRAGAVAPAGIFNDNDALGFGIRIGYYF
jgi:long-subunit fatty acid transport protein